MIDTFFQSSAVLGRTFVIGVLAYVSLVFLLRVSGRRTLSKMNAFDFVVTVALGSTLATILLNRDVSLAEGTLALGLLIALQFVITWSSVRVAWVKRAVTGDPMLLLYRGEMLMAEMKRSRVTEDEVRAAIRAASIGSIDDVGAVVLETDGSFSVLPRFEKDASSLAGVRGGDAETGR
jgi:uncharacterized membrane protein YcaP (DUF421 family)